MGFLVNNGQFAKVLVQSHENAFFGIGASEYLIIARILHPITGPDDIVSRCFEVGPHSAPNARIEKDSHVSDSMRSGSTRSCPTRRRA